MNIMIVGCSGSGKSTLARRLGKITGLRVVHIDQFFWKPCWVQRTNAEVHQLIAEAVKQDGWIFDGNNSSSFHLRESRADILIWLDFPRRICLWRVFSRFAKYVGKTRPSMTEECPERINLEFLGYIWAYRKRSRPKVLAMVDRCRESVLIYQLKSPRQVNEFLQNFDFKALKKPRHSAVDGITKPN